MEWFFSKYHFERCLCSLDDREKIKLLTNKGIAATEMVFGSEFNKDFETT
jgi:hypothetical protein